MIDKAVNDFRRYNIVQNFHCDKVPTYFNCLGCRYFFTATFRGHEYRTSECLKTIIGEWALYHMEKENKNE